jgi:glycosyltransferase involved in cell wall biosynthesis
VASVPETEGKNGVVVDHPRFFNIPGALKATDAVLLARSVEKHFSRIVRNFAPTFVDAHWAYPDGVAAAMLAQKGGLPYFITIRGDDVNVFLRTRARRKQILDALNGARGVIGVCRDLVEAVVSEGVSSERCFLVPNGVDTKVFFPIRRDVARKELGIDESVPLLLSVGRICEPKGFHLLVRALRELYSPARQAPVLALVGEIDEERNFVSSLRAEVFRAGLENRVLIPGSATPDELRRWYSAADLFCLASSREGWPNVLLEALACGCPIMATNVGGVPEIIQDASLGILVEREVSAMATGMAEGLSRSWNRSGLAEFAQSRSWDQTAKECQSVYESFGL